MSSRAKHFHAKRLAVNGSILIHGPLGLRFVDDVREQEPAPTPAEPDTTGDTGALAFPSRPERIRENDGDIELAAAKLIEVDLAAEGDEFVEVGVVTPEIGEFAGTEHGDVSGRGEFANALNGRHGHDRVTNPVGRADEDARVLVIRDKCWRLRHQSPWRRR